MIAFGLCSDHHQTKCRLNQSSLSQSTRKVDNQPRSYIISNLGASGILSAACP